MDKFIPSTNLFVMPDLFRGIARVADFWGTLDRYRFYKSEREADLAAIKYDYAVIARDLQTALKEYERSREKSATRNIK